MINVGLYYKVKKGHKKEFEEMFNKVLEMLKGSNAGFLTGKLYREVGTSNEYLIYTEWKDFESFKEFISSRSFSDAQEYGKSILEGMPRHRIFREETV